MIQKEGIGKPTEQKKSPETTSNIHGNVIYNKDDISSQWGKGEFFN